MADTPERQEQRQVADDVVAEMTEQPLYAHLPILWIPLTEVNSPGPVQARRR
jgi:hypothetical protein